MTGKHRRIGEEITSISPGTRRKILAQDGTTRELPEIKEEKKPKGKK